MADVFVSYAREDRPAAERIARLLQANGLSVWWDKAMIAGADINAVVDAELEAAKAVIVLWSPHSVTSHWVRGEAQTAVDADKLVPIEIAPCKLPINFRHFHTPQIQSDAGALDALARLLTEKLGGKPAGGEARPAPVHFKPESQQSFRAEMRDVLFKPDRSFWRQMEREKEFTRKHPVKVIGGTVALYAVALAALQELGLQPDQAIAAASFVIVGCYFLMRAYLLRRGG